MSPHLLIDGVYVLTVQLLIHWSSPSKTGHYNPILRSNNGLISEEPNQVYCRRKMKTVSVDAAVLIGTLFISCCLAYGPFQLPDDRSSPPPTYDFDGYNITLREGDIIDRGGADIGQAAAVGVPWKNGRIPYLIDCSIKNLPDAINSLNDAIKVWQEKTCIRFVPKEASDEHFVTFFRAAGCWASDVGYHGRSSSVSIGHGCEYKHVMVHELGHVIGFWHEQSRPDRNNHVRVVTSNILPSLLYNFDVVTSKTDSHGEDYDFGSIMHYPLNAFALNPNQQTLIPLQDLQGKVPYVKLSDSDITQANKMYECTNIPDVATQKEDDCIDEHRLCADWARFDHCFSNPEPMLLFCKKSCGNCGPCRDESSNCPKRYNYLACVGNANFAFRECKAVCEVCKPDPVPTSPPTDPPTLPSTDPPTFPPTNPPTVPATQTANVVPTTALPPVVTSTEIIPPDKQHFGVVCVDRSDNCEEWRTDGRCQRDQWVYRNCLLQCSRTDICDVKAFSPTGTCANSLGLSRHYKNVEPLPDGNFQGSSSFYPGGNWGALPYSGRLYNVDNHRRKLVGAWCADPNRGKDSWFQVNFGGRKRITGVATQGRDVYFEHVKTYEVEYRDESTGQWMPYSLDGKPVVFNGNCDHFTPVLNVFTNPITSQIVRIRPKTFRGAACLRVEFFGCDA